MNSLDLVALKRRNLNFISNLIHILVSKTEDQCLSDSYHHKKVYLWVLIGELS